MCANPFTQEQVLSGIRIIWREDYNYDLPIYPDMSFIEPFRTKGLFKPDIDLYDVLYRLEWLFGFSCPNKDWETFLGLHIRDSNEWERVIAPGLTFEALVDFIRERLNPISLEPLTLLGKPCLTAGVFRGLEQLAEQINPKVRRFAPGTPIRARLHGFRLHCFWSRLRWLIEDQLPPPRRISIRSLRYLRSWGCLPSLFVKLGIGLLIALWKRDLAGLLEGIAVALALFIPVGIIVAFINERLDPLPEGIETFGDLARVLAAIIMDQQPQGA